MPRPIASGICDAVKKDLQDGERDLKTLVSRHGISSTKARSMRQRFLTTGEVINTNKKKGTGRRRKLSAEQIESLRLFLEDHPDAFLKEMVTFMDDLYGIRVNGSTMQRTCVRIGWKLKKQPRTRDDTGFWVRTLPRDEEGNAIRDPAPVTKRPANWGTKLSYTRRRALLEKTREWVKSYMSQPPFDGSHDYSHIQRVLALCFQILRVEQKEFRAKACDGLALELLALMHDIEDHKYHPRAGSRSNEQHSAPSSATSGAYNHDAFGGVQSQQPNSTLEQRVHSAPFINPSHESSQMTQSGGPVSTVEERLLRIGWPPYITTKVAAMTPYVSYTAEKSNPEAFAAALAQHPEIAFVQDADRLDAIGATGIGRTFAYTGAKDREGGLMATMDHFRTKLVNLHATMKTGEGRRLATVRTERLRTFGRWWLDEMCMIDQEHGDMAWIQSPPPSVQAPPPSVAGTPSGMATHAVEGVRPVSQNDGPENWNDLQPAAGDAPLSVQLTQAANQG